jgi:PAT family beta-lactamase induction signal transducer AmpG
LRYTATHFALISAASSIVGRIVTGTTAGALIESMGYFYYYVLTTIVAFPGIALFWYMMRRGFIDSSLGSVGKALPGEGPQAAARAESS